MARFFKTRTSLIVAVLMTSLTSLALVAGTVLYQTSGTSSFQYFKDANDKAQVTVTKQDYTLYREYQPSGTEQLYLVDYQATTQMPLEAEGLSGKVNWSVRSGNNFGTVLWKNSEDANTLNVNHEYGLLLTGVDGCCAEITGYRAYDLKTGKLVLSFNDFIGKELVIHPFILEVPNSDLEARFIGLVSGDSTRDRDFQPAANGFTPVLLIKYATKSGGVLERLQIDLQVATGFAPSVMAVSLEKDVNVQKNNIIEIRDGKATLWNIDKIKDPGQIEGVILRVVVNGGQGDKTLLIPVRNDRLDLSKAQIPDGLTLRAL